MKILGSGEKDKLSRVRFCCGKPVLQNVYCSKSGQPFKSGSDLFSVDPTWNRFFPHSIPTGPCWKCIFPNKQKELHRACGERTPWTNMVWSGQGNIRGTLVATIFWPVSLYGCKDRKHPPGYFMRSFPSSLHPRPKLPKLGIIKQMRIHVWSSNLILNRTTLRAMSEYPGEDATTYKRRWAIIKTFFIQPPWGYSCVGPWNIKGYFWGRACRSNYI